MNEPNSFFGIRTIFIRAVQEIWCSVNGPTVYANLGRLDHQFFSANLQKSLYMNAKRCQHLWSQVILYYNQLPSLT